MDIIKKGFVQEVVMVKRRNDIVSSEIMVQWMLTMQTHKSLFTLLITFNLI